MQRGEGGDQAYMYLPCVCAYFGYVYSLKWNTQIKYYAYFWRDKSMHAYAYAYLCISMHNYVSCVFMQKIYKL